MSSYGTTTNRRSVRPVVVACLRRELLPLNELHLTLSGLGCAEPSV